MAPPPILRALALLALVAAGAQALRVRDDGHGRVAYLLQTAEEACPCPVPAQPSCECARVHELTPEQAVRWQISKHGFEEPAYRGTGDAGEVGEAVVNMVRTGDGRLGGSALGAVKNPEEQFEADEAAFGASSASASGSSAAASVPASSSSSASSEEEQPSSGSAASASGDASASASASSEEPASSGSSSDESGEPAPSGSASGEAEPSSATAGSESASGDDSESSSALESEFSIGSGSSDSSESGNDDANSDESSEELSEAAEESSDESESESSEDASSEEGGAASDESSDASEESSEAGGSEEEEGDDDSESSSSSSSSSASASLASTVISEEVEPSDEPSSESSDPDDESDPEAPGGAASDRIELAGKIVRELMEEKKVDEHALAVQARVAPDVLHAIVTGDAAPTAPVIERMNTVLEANINDLIEKEMDSGAGLNSSWSGVDYEALAAAEDAHQKEKTASEEAEKDVLRRKNDKQQREAEEAAQNAKDLAAKHRAAAEKLKEEAKAALAEKHEALHKLELQRREGREKFREAEARKAERAAAQRQAEDRMKSDALIAKTKEATAKARENKAKADAKEVAVKAKAAEAARQEQASKRAVEVANERLRHLKKKEAREKARMAEQKAKAIAAEKARALRVERALEASTKKKEEAAAKRLAASARKEQDMKAKAAASERAEKQQVKETEAKKKAAVIRARREAADKKANEARDKRNREAAKKHAQRVAEMQRRELDQKRISEQQEKFGKEVGITLHGLGQRMIGRAASGAKAWNNRNYQFTTAPKGTFGSTYVVPGMDTKVCPKEGGAYFSVKHAAYAHLCCGHGSHPTTDGWEPRPGAFALRNHGGKPCQFFRRPMAPGEKIRACCDTSWATGVFLNAMSTAVSRINRQPMAALVSARGHNQVVQRSNPGTGQRVFRDRKHEFTTAPEGVFSNHYLFSSVEPRHAAACPKWGGANFRLTRPSYVYMACAARASPTTSGWERLDGEYAITAHPGRPLTWYKRVVMPGADFRACCDVSWATGVFVSPDVVPKPEQDPPCSTPDKPLQRVIVNAGRFTNVWQDRRYTFNDAPLGVFGSEYVYGPVDKGAVCPKRGGASFKARKNGVVFAGCGHGGRPTGKGAWVRLAGSFTLNAHGGRPLVFYSRPIKVGEQVTVCCSTNWATGAFVTYPDWWDPPYWQRVDGDQRAISASASPAYKHWRSSLQIDSKRYSAGITVQRPLMLDEPAKRNKLHFTIHYYDDARHGRDARNDWVGLGRQGPTYKRDYVLGVYHTEDRYSSFPAWAPSMVKRHRGWHTFEFVVRPGKVIGMIDGIVVRSWPLAGPVHGLTVRGNMRSKASWSPWTVKGAADLTLAQRNELLDRSATLHLDQRRSAGKEKLGLWLDVSGHKNHGRLMYGAKLDDRGAADNTGTLAGLVKVPADVTTQAPRRTFSMEVWFRPAQMTVTNGGGFLMAKPGLWYLELAEDGRLRVYCYGVKPAGYHYSNGRVDHRGAHHAAYVYDGRAHHIYIDGRLDRRIPATGTPDHRRVKYEVGIGSYVRSARAHHWQGKVYAARYYNDMALSPHDVKDRYVFDARRFGVRKPSRLEQADRYVTLEFDTTSRRRNKRVLLDQSGFGHDAALRGKAFFDDRNALVVARPGDFVYTAPSKFTVPGSRFSLEAWFAAASVRTTNGGGTIVSKRGAYYFEMVPGGKLRVHVAGLRPSRWIVSRAKCWPGQTVHAAFSYDGRVGRLFINGALDSTVALTGTPSRHNGYGVDVGARGPRGQTHRFRGKVFVVRLYRTLALAPADVALRYNTERPKFPGDSAPPAKFLQHAKGVFLPVRRRIVQGPALRHKGKYSIMFWIKLMGTSDRWTSVLHHGTSDRERAPAVFIYPNLRRLHIRSSTNAAWNFGLDPPHYLKLNKWTHVAFSHGGGEMRVWLDGVLAAEADAGDPKRGVQGATFCGNPWYDTTIAMMADVMYTPGLVNGFHVAQAIKAAKFPRGGVPPHLVAERPMRMIRRGFYRMSIVKHMEFRGRHTRSLSFWVQPHGLQHGWGNIVFKGANDALRGFGIWFHPSSLRLHVRSGSSRSTNDGYDPPQHLAMHRWSHVAVSHDAAFIKVWINGRMVVRAKIGAPRYKKGRMWLSASFHRPALARIADVRWFDLPIAHSDAQALYGARGSFVKAAFPVQTVFKGTDRSRRNRIVRKVPFHQGAYTLSFWVRPRGRVQWWTSLLQFGDAGNVRRPSFYMYPGSTRLHYRSGSFASWNDGCDPGQHLPIDRWTHVIVQHMSRRIRVLFNMREVCNSDRPGPLDVRRSDRVWISDRFHVEATAQIADIRFAESFLPKADLLRLHRTRSVQFNRWPDSLTLVARNTRPQQRKPLPLGRRMRAAYGYTLTLWLRPEGVLEPWANIFHKGDKNQRRNVALWFYPGSTRLHVRSGTPSGWNYGVDPPHVVPLHQWTHVAIVHTQGRFEVYFNNRMVVRHTGALQPTPNGDHMWLSDPWHWRALAMVSDLRYFDMPLNMAELKTVYRQRRFNNYARPPAPTMRLLQGPQVVRPGLRLATLPNRHVDRLRHTGAYSMSFWIKPRGLRHTWGNIIRKGHNGHERRPGVWFYPQSTRLHVRSRVGGSWNWGVDPGQHLPLFVWSYVCVQHRQGRFRVWINGDMRVDVPARAPIDWRSPMFVSEPGTWSAVAQIADMHYAAKWWVPAEVRKDRAGRKFNAGVWPPQVTLRAGPFHARRAANPAPAHLGGRTHPGGYTWSFWVRPEGVRRHWASILHHGDANTHRSIGVWFHPHTTRLHIRSSSHAHWNHGNDPRHELTPLVWTHVAVTHTFGSLRVYLNGALHSDQKLKAEPVNYGGRIWMGDQHHVEALATLADVRLFRQPLSDAELRQVPRQRRPPNPRPQPIRTMWGHPGVQARQGRLLTRGRAHHRGAYSVSFWVQPRGIQPSWGSILHKGERNTERNPGVWFFPGSTRLHIRSGSSRNWNDGHDLRHGLGMYGWHHIVITHQHQRLKIYVNRRLTVSAGRTGPQYFHPGHVQRWWGSDPWHWPAMGQLGDVRFAPRPISQGEVNHLYAHRRVQFNRLPHQIHIYGRKAFRPRRNHIASMGGGIGHSHGVSWSFWIRVLGVRGGWTNVFHHGNHNTHRSGALWMFPGSSRMHFRSSSSNSWNTGLDSRALKVGQWTHVVFTHSFRDMRMYLDGGQRPNEPRNFYHTNRVSYPRNYGGKLWASDPWHNQANVEVRDLRHWHMPLTPHEVRLLRAGRI